MFTHLELPVLRGAYLGKISTNYGPEIEICRGLEVRGYLHDISRSLTGERIFRLSTKADAEMALFEQVA